MSSPMWTNGSETMSRAKQRVRALNNRLRVETGAPVGTDTCGRTISRSPVKLEPTGDIAVWPPTEASSPVKAMPWMGSVQKEYVHTDTDRKWQYRADVIKGSCYDGSLGFYPEPEPEQPKPLPSYPDRTIQAAEFRTHLRNMLAATRPFEEDTTEVEDDGEVDVPPRKDNAAGIAHDAAHKLGARAEGMRAEMVTFGTLQTELVGIIENVLMNPDELPEMSEVTPQRQAQLDRLKAEMPRPVKEGGTVSDPNGPKPVKKWKAPRGGNVFKVTKTKKPEAIAREAEEAAKAAEAAAAQLAKAESQSPAVQIVLGVGDSSFVRSLEYYPQERKLRVMLKSTKPAANGNGDQEVGRCFWFHDVEDDFMAAFRTRMGVDVGEGDGTSQLFTTPATFDSCFGNIGY